MSSASFRKRQFFTLWYKQEEQLPPAITIIFSYLKTYSAIHLIPRQGKDYLHSCQDRATEVARTRGYRTEIHLSDMIFSEA